MKKTTYLLKTLLISALLMGANSAWGDVTTLYERGYTTDWSNDDRDGTSWTGDLAATSISDGLKIGDNSSAKSVAYGFSYSPGNLLSYDFIWTIGWSSQDSNSNFCKLSIGNDVIQFKYYPKGATLKAYVNINGTDYLLPNYYDRNDDWTIHVDIDPDNHKLLALTISGSKKIVDTSYKDDPTKYDAFNYNLYDITANNSINLSTTSTYSAIGLSMTWGKGTVNTGLKKVRIVEFSSVSATIGSTGWTTFASAFPLNLSSMSASSGEVTAYYASAVGGGSVTLTSTDKSNLAAGEGIMLKGTVGATITIPVVASGEAITGNKLVGCTSSTVLDANASYYVLVNNGSGTAEFQSLKTNGATIPAGKAYLDTSISSAKSLRIIVDGQASEVVAPEVAEIEEEEVLYNMAGLRVGKDYKGFVINQKGVKRFNR